jgi:hypothetical protein
MLKTKNKAKIVFFKCIQHSCPKFIDLETKSKVVDFDILDRTSRLTSAALNYKLIKAAILLLQGEGQSPE